MLDPLHLGARRVDARLGIGDRALGIVEAELRGVELLGEGADALAVRVDLVLDRLGLGALVPDGVSSAPAARPRTAPRMTRLMRRMRVVLRMWRDTNRPG